MNSNINFLFAVIAVIGIAFLAMLTRSCGGAKHPLPAYFDRTLTVDSAAALGKPVLVYVGADWCPPCQTLKGGALADRRVEKWVRENAVAVYVDATSVRDGDDTSLLLLRLGTTAYPDLILMRQKQVVARLTGAVRAKDLLAWLDKSAKAPTPAG
ncbi:MAG: thioredoxin fold domain-containing protein [Phycisphaerae bacterium]|nr:thioredoxin fold domain-containing protein [Phycisphaerae bacterium]